MTPEHRQKIINELSAKADSRSIDLMHEIIRIEKETGIFASEEEFHLTRPSLNDLKINGQDNETQILDKLMSLTELEQLTLPKACAILRQLCKAKRLTDAAVSVSTSLAAQAANIAIEDWLRSGKKLTQHERATEHAKFFEPVKASLIKRHIEID